MDASDVENAEKLSEDLVRGENDLGNGQLGGEHEKLDEMDVDNENACKEVSMKDQSEVENGADDQSHRAGNGPSEICEEVMAPEKNAMEDEQGTGRGSVEEEKGPGRDSVEEDKGTGKDSVKEEKCTGRDSMKEEKGTGKDSVELNITATDSVEEKDTGKDSLEEENGTGKVYVEEEKDTGKDSVEEENGTGKLSVEVEKGTGKDFVEEEKGIGKDSVEEEDGIGRESVEEKSTGKESMEEKAIGKESVEEEKVTGKESVEEEKVTSKESVEEEKVTDKESVEEGKVTFNESLDEKVTGKESVEEKVIGKGCVEEEKGYFSEFPTNGEAEENKIEKGGIMVAETNGKTAVTSVVNDGKPGHSEVLENEDEDDCVAMDDNNEAAGDSNYRSENKNDVNGGTEMRQSDNCLAADQAESLTPNGVGKYNVEKLKENGDTNEVPVFQLTEEEETGTPEEQANFFTELEKFYKGRSIDFKAPKFYGQILNCLKLYRAVTRLGGYDRVTGLKLWRQIGESFHPPKTCTTVSWTFRIFYEKALLEYERHKLQNGELQLAIPAVAEPIRIENENPGSGRQRRDAAARAMQGWHAQRHYGYGEVGEPIIKDKNVNNMPKREKYLKSIGSLKHKRQGEVEYPMKAARTETSKQLVATVVDVGPPADWVKINIRESKHCFEVYALVPGLLREEVRVQSDPAGRLVITGQPEQNENPWGITSFKKVISLPGRIDPLQTSAVVSLHGRLFVRVPFEKSSV